MNRRSLTRFGAVTAACGLVVFLWGQFEYQGAATTAEIAASAAYVFGGIGLLLAGVWTIREPDPDAQIHTFLTWLTFASVGLVLAGALVPQVL